MERQVRTRTGITTRTLSASEITTLADMGDEEARIEVLKNRLIIATTDSEKLNLLIAFITRDNRVR